MPVFVPAEPTIDRLERYWSVIHEIEEHGRVKRPAAEPVPEAADDGSIGAVARAFEAQGAPAPAGDVAGLLLDVNRLFEAMWGAKLYRQVAAVVMMKEDGSDVTEEEVGKVRPSEVGRAVVPFSQELNRSWNTLQSGAAAEE